MLRSTANNNSIVTCYTFLSLTSRSTIFKQYHHGVWMWQSAQCSFLLCGSSEITCTETWRHFQQCWAISRWCLNVTDSSVLICIVMPLWNSIFDTYHDIPTSHIILTPNEPVLVIRTFFKLSAKPRAASTIFKAQVKVDWASDKQRTEPQN